MTETAYIGLGSNLGDRVAYLEAAVAELENLAGVSVLSSSSVYETPPAGFLDQPHFLNAVVAVETELSPHELLQALRLIEDGHRRQRSIRWGPRTLDLDLLACGDRVVRTTDLTLPHPHLTERCFVLAPLCEIAPDLKHSVSGRPMSEYERQLECRGQVALAGSLAVPQSYLRRVTLEKKRVSEPPATGDPAATSPTT